MDNSIAMLERTLGYKFKDNNLITTALCHKSYINESGKEQTQSYERLEFLGDSVLGLVVSKYIYDHYPALPEGSLSKLRASVVCEKSLSQVARALSIGKYIILSKGEKQCGGADKDAILCDVTESIIAAMYIDSGCNLDLVGDFVINMLRDTISYHASVKGDDSDYKSFFQEVVQRDGGTVTYESVSESGPDHDKTFVVGVYVNDKLVAKGTGSSKKKAQQDAACNALKKMK